MPQQRSDISVSLQDFSLFLDIILEMQAQHRWRFIFQSKKNPAVSLDKEIFEQRMSEVGIDPNLFRTILGQISNMITALLDNEKDIAIPWFVENYDELEDVILQKFELVEKKLINEELRTCQKLFEKCVFTFLKNVNWGLENKYLDPENSEETFKVGTLNLVIQDNNPFLTTETSESNINLTLTHSEVMSLIKELNMLKEKLKN